MKNSQQAASPTDTEIFADDKYQIRKLGGLTKLEWMAGQIAAGFVDKESFEEISALAAKSVQVAQAILGECEKRSQ